MAEMDEIADALFRALTEDDFESLRGLLADDFRFWSNGAGAEGDRDAFLAGLAGMRRVLADHRYDDVRRTIGTDGFAEQHRVRGHRADGGAVDLGDVCVVVRVDDAGRVRRLDEYVDTAHAGTVLG